jgi:hypothetical protein
MVSRMKLILALLVVLIAVSAFAAWVCLNVVSLD